MVITLEPNAPTAVVDAVCALAARHAGISPRVHQFSGTQHALTEVHLIGKNTHLVPTSVFEGMAGVRRVVRVSTRYRLIGRHGLDAATAGFEYNGVTFGDDHLNIFAGLCAVDTPEHVEQMVSALEQHGLNTARMGAYKPRTSPYDFQGLGSSCLPWLFETCGRHGIKVVAMEITDVRNIDEIRQALEDTGQATGVMLQIGTRNAQNFELLKGAGQQATFPVLFKRGMGISLEESLNACEYVASEGNPNIVFCLRGVKSHLGEPHRNLVDFAHVPVVRRLTRLPVCIDPSHSVGKMALAPDGLPDIYHACAQGLISGASNVLVDFHPQPTLALCDGPQALTLAQLPGFLASMRCVRQAYLTLTQAAV